MDLFLGVFDLMALCLLGWRLSMSKLIPLSSMSQRFSISGSPGFTLAYLLLSIEHFPLCEFSLCYSKVVQNRMNIIQGCVFSRGSSSEQKPTRVYAQRPVRQTKVTPCGECVGKVPESFAQVLARCSSLAQTKYMTRHNAALIELYFDGNAKGPQACRLFSSLVLTSGAQPVVPVRRRSCILRCSCLCRAHTKKCKLLRFDPEA